MKRTLSSLGVILAVFIVGSSSAKAETVDRGTLAGPTPVPNSSSTSNNPVLIKVVSGDNQHDSPAVFLAQPLVVKVTTTSGTPLANVLVNFAITGTADGGVSASYGGHVGHSLSVKTDPNGYAEVYYAGALTDGIKSSISVTAGGASATLNESTDPCDNSVAAPTNITVSPPCPCASTTLKWTNNATNATFLIILISTDGIYWTPITTLNDPTVTSYTVKGLDRRRIYFFGVIAGNPN